MEINATTQINRPVEAVFAYVCEVSNDVHWRTGVTAAGLRSEPPLSIGSIGFAQAGNATTEYRVLDFSPGNRVDWELISGPYQGRGGYRFRETAQGTQFTLVAELEPTGLFKLLGPLFRWIGKRQNQADVDKLRTILEGQVG